MFWLAALGVIAKRLYLLPQSATRRDFSIFYSSAVAMRRGLNPYLDDLSAIAAQFHLTLAWNIHTTSTPTFLMLFEPLAMLPPRAAFWCWFALSAASFVVAAGLMLGDQDSALDRAQAQVFGALMLLYTPVSEHIIESQAQFILLPLFVVMMRALKRGNDGRAGLAFALAGTLRAFPFVMGAYLILKRRWRALFFGALGVAVIELITLAALGWPMFACFIRFVLHAPANIADISVNLPVNASLLPFITRGFRYIFGPDLGPRLDRVRALTVLMAQLGVIALAVRATLRQPADRDSDARAFCLWITVMLLVSPVTWVHYFVLLLLPFHQIAAASAAGRCPATVVWLAIGSVVTSSYATGLRSAALWINGHTLRSPLTEGAFAALALAYVATLRFANAGPAPVSSLPRDTGALF